MEELKKVVVQATYNKGYLSYKVYRKLMEDRDGELEFNRHKYEAVREFDERKDKR